MSASTGAWNGTQPMSYSYQWYRCDSGGNNCAVGPAGQSYLLSSIDVGRTFRVTVTASNSDGSATGTSAATAVVAAGSSSSGAPTLASPPTVSGTAQEGQTLSSSTGSWSGTQPMGYSYQWYRCDSGGNNCAVGPTGQSYLLSSTDVGRTFRVTVTASNSLGSASGTSAATAVVAAGSSSSGAPSLVSAPVISGTTQQGQTLSSSTGSWSGTQPMGYSYQWYRCDSGGNNCAVGPTGQSYLLSLIDVGRTFRVTVTASNSLGSASGTSAATAVVAAATSSSGAPTIASPPTVSGTAQQGQTLSASTGMWSGTQPMGYSYQWYRCDSGGNNCAVGPTGQSYLLSSTDVGRTFRVTVTASNSLGSARHLRRHCGR